MVLRYLYILIFLIATSGFAQELAEDDPDVLMRKDISFGLNFNTNGWGFGFDYGFQKNYKYKNVIGFVVTNIRHEKEYKIFGPLSNSKGYYFGKLVSLVGMRPYYGGKLVVFKARRENGIEISAKWNLGASLGLVKPVYLRIDKFNQPPVDEKYDPEIHNLNNITSRSSWFKGLDEAKIRPGIFGRFGADFNFAALKNGISGGEAGVMLDYYPGNKIEILHLAPAHNFFAALYLQFNLGTKLY